MSEFESPANDIVAAARSTRPDRGRYSGEDLPPETTVPAIRILLASLLLVSAAPALATDDDSDWAMFGRIVALVQPFLRLAVQSDDPRIRFERR